MKRLLLSGCLVFVNGLWPASALPDDAVEEPNLATDPANCGRVGRDCGGGACVKGACGVVVVQDGIRELGGFAVDSSGVYYTSNPGDFDMRLLRCPPSGCTVQPDQLASGLSNGQAVQLGPDDVFFGAAPIQSTTRNSVYTCPKTGCTAPPVSLFNSGLMGGAGDDLVAVGNRWFSSFGSGILSCRFTRGQPCERSGIPAAEHVYRSHGTFPLAVDVKYVYFGFSPPVEGDAPRHQNLMACPLESDCSAPTLLAADLTPAALAAFEGMVYILQKGGEGGAPNGTLGTCAAGGCGPDGPAVFARKLAHPTALAVDASGVYWFASDANEIEMCPLSGCGGGPRTVVSDVKGASHLTLSGGSVYWAAPVRKEGDATWSTLYRIAK
jgi:hypothetical protein